MLSGTKVGICFCSTYLLNDLDNRARTRVHENDVVVQNGITVLRYSIFRWDVIVLHVLLGKHGTDCDAVLIYNRWPLLFYDIVMKAGGAHQFPAVHSCRRFLPQPHHQPLRQQAPPADYLRPRRFALRPPRLKRERPTAPARRLQERQTIC